MSIRNFPQSTANNNVPKNVLIIAEDKQSEESTLTYYIDKKGNIYNVGDWKYDRPIPSYMYAICRLTGCTEQDIIFRWKTFYNIPTSIENPITEDLF